MANFGETLANARRAKDITLEKIAKDLHIKKEDLEALEKEQWQNLPEPAFVKGFVKSYAQYLNLDHDYVLALYRRAYDPKKNIYKNTPLRTVNKSLFRNPIRFAQLAFVLLVIIFALYIVAQYSAVLKSPKLVVTNPPDDQTTTVPVTLITGQTEKETTVSINGNFAPIDAEGNFSYQYKLTEGQNVIEIIAAKNLSPKAKVTKIVRLSP